ncbi:MAG: adenylate kinase [Oscillospiraceae bacterium]
MVILISGSSHTGKTLVSQKLLERLKIPYLSADHLKMGLIRSGQTALTPENDEELVPYLWSIEKEIVKTAVENKQSLIIEGCYIPQSWRKDFSEEYLTDIRAVWLIMSEAYIGEHFSEIRDNANAIEQRLDDGWLCPEALIADNMHILEECRRHGCQYILIDGEYSPERLVDRVCALL